MFQIGGNSQYVVGSTVPLQSPNNHGSVCDTGLTPFPILLFLVYNNKQVLVPLHLNMHGLIITRMDSSNKIDSSSCTNIFSQNPEVRCQSSFSIISMNKL